MSIASRSATLFICTTAGLLAMALPSMAARKAHRPAGLLKHAHYKGPTSQGTDIGFQLSNDAKRVAKLRITYRVTCDDGTSATTYTDILNAKITARKFGGQGVYRGQRDGSTNTFQIKGSLTRRSAQGTFTLSATGKTSAGRDLHCMSGTVSWTARKG
ncbi:MAG: hypothetical protein NVSMB25_03600 [Thermoleophilaceae bacterium]